VADFVACATFTTCEGYEPLDRLRRRHPRASEQELPLEQCAIERATAEDHDAGIVEREIRLEE